MKTTLLKAALLLVLMPCSSMADDTSTTDFTLPTYGALPTGDCASQRVKPAWFNEGRDMSRTRWKADLREVYYSFKRYENIIKTGSCSCNERYPDPDAHGWKPEFDELVRLHTDEQGLSTPPKSDPKTPLTRNFTRARISLYQAYSEIIDTCGEL